MSLTVGSLFSGIGGLDLAVESFFDAQTAWHCEVDPEPSKVLAARWPGVPNLGDVTAVDWATVEPVDIMCGGFPCQDLSLAGRRSGMRPGTRSGLWADFKAAIAVLRPKVVVIENVRGLLSGCAESDSDVEPCPGCVGDGQHRPVVRALGRVLGDLAALGFDAEWGSLRAADVGAPHGRFRVFIVAYRRGVRLGAGRGSVAGEASGGWRASRGAAATETMYALGAERDDTGDRQGNVVLKRFSTPDTAPEAPNTGSNSHKAGNIVGLGNQVKSLIGDTSWGPYEPAVRLWESLTREAPAPTLPDGKNGNHRLSARFTEWMMGYPAGWVTDVIDRNPAIKACGNGVVPQQAYAALEALWARIESMGVAA